MLKVRKKWKSTSVCHKSRRWLKGGRSSLSSVGSEGWSRSSRCKQVPSSQWMLTCHRRTAPPPWRTPKVNRCRKLPPTNSCIFSLPMSSEKKRAFFFFKKALSQNCAFYYYYCLNPSWAFNASRMALEPILFSPKHFAQISVLCKTLQLTKINELLCWGQDMHGQPVRKFFPDIQNPFILCTEQKIFCHSTKGNLRLPNTTNSTMSSGELLQPMQKSGFYE